MGKMLLLIIPAVFLTFRFQLRQSGRFTFRFAVGALDCLPYRCKIEIKIIVSCVYKLTTLVCKILLLYFTEMRLLIERIKISYNKRF